MTLTQAAHDALASPYTTSLSDSATARAQRWLAAHADAPHSWRDLRDAISRERKVCRDRVARALKPAPPIGERLTAHLIRHAENEIVRRNISSCTGMGSLQLIERDPQARLTLLGWAGWVRYSRRAGTWHQAARYLMGWDGGQRWIVRVPSTCYSIRVALKALIPAPVRRAQAAGRTVVRQGDVWLAELPRANNHDLSALRGTRHDLVEDERGLMLCHPEHSDLRLPQVAGYWRAYQARIDVGIGGATTD